MKARRILHLIPSMEGGGAERYLCYLAGGLVSSGWEMHVALLRGGPNLERLRNSGAKVHYLGGRWNYDPLIFPQIIRLIRRVKPSLVQTWFRQMDILGGAAAGLCGVGWLLSEQSSGEAYPATIKHRLRVALAARAAGVICNSQGGLRYWQEKLARPVRLWVIPNAVPVSEVDAVEPIGTAESAIPPEAKMVLYVGRLERVKNPKVLTEALKIVVAAPGVLAVMCGDGLLKGEVKRMLDRDGLGDRILLKGYVPDVWRWMKRADVLVSVSLFEGCPNVILEAMACGCPLVVSDIAAHRSMLRDDWAVFVAPASASSIARGVLESLSSPSGARRRAEEARSAVRQWSVQTISKAYEKAYLEAMGEDSSRETQGKSCAE